MKKTYYKICAFILLMFCALTGLAACGDSQFSIAECRREYAKAGYSVVDMSVALNQTKQYNEQKKNGKDPQSKPYYLISDNKNNLEDLYNDVYGNKKDESIKIYTNSGFIAYTLNSEGAIDKIVVIVAYRGTGKVEGFKNQIYENFYSNITKDELIYKFKEN